MSNGLKKMKRSVFLRVSIILSVALVALLSWFMKPWVDVFLHRGGPEPSVGFNAQQIPAEGLTAEQNKVLTIAKNAFAARESWIDQAVFATPNRESDGSWRVRVFKSTYDGTYRVIWITDDGKVIKYIVPPR